MVETVSRALLREVAEAERAPPARILPGSRAAAKAEGQGLAAAVWPVRGPRGRGAVDVRA